MRLNLLLMTLLSCYGSVLSAADSSDCAVCHAAIYRQWQTRPMARTSGVAGREVIESFRNSVFSNPRGTAQYKVSNDFTFDFAYAGMGGRVAIKYFLGAGLTGRSYILSTDGFLFQAPVSWYSARAAWDLSPGYEQSDEVNLTRETGQACLRCHTSGLRPIAGTSNGFTSPPWRENGVSCERCHGPGEAHIRGNRAAIVNPAKLSGESRDSVCAQCHLPGAVEIAKAGPRVSYTPGENLSDSVAVFILAGQDREASINGHFEQLSRSKCMLRSKGSLWCGTCHEVHRTLTAEEKPAFFRGRCLTCHADRPCTATLANRNRVDDNCVTCHMSRRPSATVQHAAVTDHVISRLPRGLPPDASAAASELTLFAGMQSEARANDRELGLAYASIALRSNNREWGLRAFELLRGENQAHPNDPKITSSLAQLYDRMNREDEACALYEATVRLDHSAAAAKVNLAGCLAKRGQTDQAVRLWTEVLKTNPSMETARLNLAVALFRTGRKTEAKAGLLEALRFNPASRRARELLAGLE